MSFRVEALDDAGPSRDRSGASRPDPGAVGAPADEPYPVGLRALPWRMTKNMGGKRYYSPAEERMNIVSHAIGSVLSIVALALLVARANLEGGVWRMVSASMFGASLVILYAASSCYHGAQKPELRRKLRIVDHASIYVLIAGSCTPFALVTLGGATGWTMFGIAWGLAIAGIVMKLLFMERYNVVSTVMYVLMGWVMVVALKPLLNKLPVEGVLWLFAGGISYTIGAVLYSVKTIKYNHAVFHVFVLVGSVCHFISVFFHVLPNE